MPLTDTVSRGRKPNRWSECAVLPDLGLTYVPISKSGSSSVLRLLWDAGISHKGPGADQVTTPAVAMLREPGARAWSAYRMLDKYGPTMYGDPTMDWSWHPNPCNSYAEFLAELADNADHPSLQGGLMRQTEYLCSPVEYTLVKWDFERLGEILGLTLPHLNKGTNVPKPDITPEMQYHLDLIYGADYKLWESIA